MIKEGVAMNEFQTSAESADKTSAETQNKKEINDIFLASLHSNYKAYLTLHKKQLHLIAFNIVNISDKSNVTIIFRVNNLQYSHERLHVIIRLDIMDQKAIMKSDLFVVPADVEHFVEHNDHQGYQNTIIALLKRADYRPLREATDVYFFRDFNPQAFAVWMNACFDFETYLGMAMAQDYGVVASALLKKDARIASKSHKFKKQYGHKIVCSDCESTMHNTKMIYKDQNKTDGGYSGPLASHHRTPFESVVLKNQEPKKDAPLYMVKVKNGPRFMYICNLCHPRRSQQARKYMKEFYEKRRLRREQNALDKKKKIEWMEKQAIGEAR
jgi:hypothetical protein